jgi:uncharacterized protein YkwD
MNRVALPVIASVFLAGCAVGSANLSSGFSQGASAPRKSASLSDTSTRGLGGEPSTRTETATRSATKVAALDDRAPKGQSEKAPPGALADRNYSATSLNPEQARALINEYRKSNGLKPLALNAALTEAAKAHSRDLAKWDRISHYGSDGSNPWDRVKRVGYNAKLAAENVGTGQAAIDEVMKGWKDSPGHNKNLLLKDATEMGIALVQDDKTEFKTFWTLVIGSSM